MAKYTMTLHSRPLYLDDQTRRVPGELFTAVGHCDYSDDAEANNDFDVTLVSDGSRYSAVIANDTALQAKTNLRGTAITGTRTSGTIFTRTAGTWVVDAHIGWLAYAYIDTAPSAGGWFKITDNDGTTITITGTLTASCNRIALLNAPAIRQNIRMIPQEGFYGTYFQYKIEKKVPASGIFKWHRMDLDVVPRPNIEPEFIGALGTNQKQWESNL
jgi:hypothetical protein